MVKIVQTVCTDHADFLFNRATTLRVDLWVDISRLVASYQEFWFLTIFNGLRASPVLAITEDDKVAILLKEACKMTSHDSVVVIYSTRRLVSTLQVAKYRLAAIYKVAKSRPCCTNKVRLSGRRKVRYSDCSYRRCIYFQQRMKSVWF